MTAGVAPGTGDSGNRLLGGGGARTWRVALVAAGITALAAGLRLHGLAGPSLSYDEIAIVEVARRPLPEMLPAIRDLAGQAPANFLVVRAVADYGLEEARLRAPAALCGTAAVLALLWVVQPWYGRAVAAGAAVLLAVSPLHVAYAQQARFYGLFSLTTIVLLGLLWRAVHAQGRWWPAAAAAVVAAYSHYYALFVLTAVALYAAGAWIAGWVSRRAALGAGAVWLGAIVVFAPWFVYDLRAGIGGQLIASNVTWSLAGRLLDAFAVGENAGVSVPSAVLGILAVLGIVRGLRRHRQATVFALVVGVVGLAGALGVARIAPYYFAPAQILFLVPIYLACAASGIAAVADRVPWRVARRVVWVGGMVAVASLSLPALQRHYTARPSDWRAAAQVVLDNIGRDDAVTAPAGRDALLFYAPEFYRRVPAATRISTAMTPARRASRAWIVAPWRARLHPDWRAVRAFLASRVVVDLSPSPDPAVYYVTDLIGRRATCWTVLHFDLPLETVARSSLLPDCLAALGPVPEVMAQIERLRAATDMPGRNRVLLQVSRLLPAGKRG